MVRKRNPRIDRLVRSALAEILEIEIADPRVAFVTLTEVDVTPDHDVATIYYSTLDPGLVATNPRRTGGDRLPDPEEVAEGLASASPRLRTLLAGRVKLKATPELRFKADRVKDEATRIDEVLRQLERDEQPGSVPIDEDVYKSPRAREDDQ